MENQKIGNLNVETAIIMYRALGVIEMNNNKGLEELEEEVIEGYLRKKRVCIQSTMIKKTMSTILKLTN